MIVFVQGSTWTTPNLEWQVPQLGRYAQNGYAVATVSHRSSVDGHAFPAYLQDVKTALRFLRANAEAFGLDKERFALFGTSSGGNAALLAALTPGDPRYQTGEFADESDAVRCVIACFAPTDLTAYEHASGAKEFQESPVYAGLVGKQNPLDVMRGMSPILEIRPGREYPAMLLANGDQDELVPFFQAEAMYREMLDHGYKAQLIKVIGAPHEGSFWSERLHGLFSDFLRDNL